MNSLVAGERRSQNCLNSSALVDDVGPSFLAVGFGKCRADQIALILNVAFGVGESERQCFAAPLKLANAFPSFAIHSVKIQHIHQLKAGNTDKGKTETDQNVQQHYFQRCGPQDRDASEEARATGSKLSGRGIPDGRDRSQFVNLIILLTERDLKVKIDVSQNCEKRYET